MNLRAISRNACAFAAALLLCAPASAQLFRAYVSSNGNDANPCTLPQPCRLLPAALTAVATGGEIWMLDSANYNTAQVNVTKSVTILAVPGALGSVLATGGGDAIYINAPSVKVTLRNLVIVHLTSSHFGITFAQGAELNVVECEIANIQSGGIYATADNSKVSVKNTVVRNSQDGFHALGTVVASLDGVRIANGYYGVFAGDDSKVTVRDSVLSGNVFGAAAYAETATARLVVENSAVTGNQYGIIAQAPTSSGVAQTTLSDSTVAHNGSGIYGAQGAGSTATLVLERNKVTQNSTGVHFAGGPPTIYTRDNNVMKFNTPDVTGGSLTTLAAQ